MLSGLRFSNSAGRSSPLTPQFSDRRHGAAHERRRRRGLRAVAVSQRVRKRRNVADLRGKTRTAGTPRRPRYGECGGRRRDCHPPPPLKHFSGEHRSNCTHAISVRLPPPSSERPSDPTPVHSRCAFISVPGEHVVEVPQEPKRERRGRTRVLGGVQQDPHVHRTVFEVQKQRDHRRGQESAGQ